MSYIFIIVGYGIPKDIMKDENYNFYLKIAFNKIWDIVMRHKIKKPIIILSGGKTDIFKPYKRSEADEMLRLFNHLARRFTVKEITNDWILLSENKSISSLENILFSKQLLSKKKIKKYKVNIICEHTRRFRLRAIAEKLFNAAQNYKIITVDFDVSSNRYLDIKFLKKKEKKAVKIDLWAFKQNSNLKKHHQLHLDRLKYFKQAGPKKHQEAIKKWWEEKLEGFKKT